MRHIFILCFVSFLYTGSCALADLQQPANLQNVSTLNQGSRLDALITARDKMMQDARAMDVQLNELKPAAEGRASPDGVVAARQEYEKVKKLQDENQVKLNQIMAIIAEERKKLFNER